MKFCFVVALLLAAVFSRGQDSWQYRRAIKLSVDSVSSSDGFRLREGWTFSDTDDTAAARLLFDDLQWQQGAIGGSALHYEQIKGPRWHRIYIDVDSSLAGQVLALQVNHLGASEIYLDGNLLEKYGTIRAGKPTENERPVLPVFFTFPTSGIHLIAVRYANSKENDYHKNFENGQRGFTMSIGMAAAARNELGVESRIVEAILFTLLAIFFVLAFSHLCLYLFYRAMASNLFFSLLCLSVSALFAITLWQRLSSEPEAILFGPYYAAAAVSGICSALSGMVNNLFSKNRIRFYIIVCSSVIAWILFRLLIEPGAIVYVCLVVAVAIETIILICRAIIRRVEGAGILGGGFLVVCCFVIITIVFSVSHINKRVEISGRVGNIVAAAAMGSVLAVPVSVSLYLAWSFATAHKKLKRKLAEVEELSAKNLEQEQEKKKILEEQNVTLERQVAQRTSEILHQKEQIERQHSELIAEKSKADALLRNILPEEVADELKESGQSQAKLFGSATILFTDFVGFTNLAEQMEPQELVDELHSCFKAFDEITSRYGIEKIKTIGDAYLAVCGLPAYDPEHAFKTVQAALDIRDFISERKKLIGTKSFDIRIGIHSGPVVAGIVGIKKFAYDIWGDTVNVAARMEQSGAAGKVNISAAVYEMIKSRFNCEYRGELAAKNKGLLKMYFAEWL